MAKDAAAVMVAPVATDGRAGLASCHRCNGQPDSTRPRRARAEHDGGPAAGGRAAPAARPLALRDRTTAEGAPSITGGLGDVMAALQERGALPPLSPVPGQLATLCARLNLKGHGITTPPARDLPEPWLSVLTQYQQRENRGGAGARRRRRRGRCPARTGRNPAHDPWPAELRGQHHRAHARQRPGMSRSLRAGQTLFLATGMYGYATAAVAGTPPAPAARAD